MIELRYVKRLQKVETVIGEEWGRYRYILQYRNGTPIETHPEARNTLIEYVWTDWKDVPVVEEE